MDTQPAAHRGRWGRVVAWQVVGVAAFAIVLYARTIRYGLYLDDYALARPWRFREAIGTLWGEFDTAGFNDAYYRPLSSMSFGIEWGIWGLKTWGYHLTNIALHVGASIGVLFLLRRLRLPAWCAVAGALYFAAVPANVATVVYVAERTDAMVAICVLVAMQFVVRFDRTRVVSTLVAINACLAVALLAKEIGVAMVPMVACLWWYLRVASSNDGVGAPGPESAWRGGAGRIVGAWRGEVGLGWHTAIDRGGRRAWACMLGPMVALVVVYLVYRSIVLPSGSLGDRFGETQNPVRALIGGVNSTIKGVPWEVKEWAYVPLLALVGLALVLRPVSATWRVVLLGGGFVVSGVVPLTFSGGVEPRLLYVAEIGMAVVVAGVATVLAEAVAAAAADRRERALRVVAAGVLGSAVAVLTLVSLVDAQHLYREGSDMKLEADQRIYDDPVLRGYVERHHLDTIERRLRDAGRL